MENLPARHFILAWAGWFETQDNTGPQDGTRVFIDFTDPIHSPRHRMIARRLLREGLLEGHHPSTVFGLSDSGHRELTTLEARRLQLIIRKTGGG